MAWLILLALAGVWSALVGWIARDKGREFLPWFFFGFFGGIIALIVVVMIKPRQPRPRPDRSIPRPARIVSDEPVEAIPRASLGQRYQRPPPDTTMKLLLTLSGFVVIGAGVWAAFAYVQEKELAAEEEEQRALEIQEENERIRRELERKPQRRTECRFCKGTGEKGDRDCPTCVGKGFVE